MYPIYPSNEPAGQPGYLPYFYNAGLFVKHLVPAVDTRPQGYRQGDSADDFSSGFPSVPGFEHVQTVEQIIAHGYFAVPSSNPITALISDKAHTARLGLDDVIHQVRSRYEIYERNIEELNQAVCEVNNCLFRQLAEHGTLVANQRQQYAVAKQTQKLYEQQRDERTTLWKDVSTLKLVLPETAQNYLAAYRKAAILRENPGDAQ